MPHRLIIEKRILAALDRFPKTFDQRLRKGFERLYANASAEFLNSRSTGHLQKILLTQFYLQKKMEVSLQEDSELRHQFFLKLFRTPSRVCIAFCFLDSSPFRRDYLLKTIQTFLPWVQEIPYSFYLWLHPDLPYLFSYQEVYKLRGEELSTADLKKLENTLQEQLEMTSPLTPALFWPYNEEESYRQVQYLLNEIRAPYDFPQISIHFQKQTPSSLEFLIHLARPESSETLQSSLERLPEHLDFFCHFQKIIRRKPSIEVGAFALKVSSHAFDVRDSINLLYARRYVMKSLETILGPCRDYNGGLFEKQQEHFELLRVHLSDKIPLFDLFAEKVFYALHPVEKRLLLSIADADILFSAFSDAMQKKNISHKIDSEKVTIIKSTNPADLPRLSHLDREFKKDHAYARVHLGGFHYHCVLRDNANSIGMLSSILPTKEKAKIFRLIFEEGKPTSLNPYHSSGDMRCRLLCKLLFEGLMRLDARGEPELAGAMSYESNRQGTVYTFKLRPNHWTNGERVTAIDYTTSLQHALREHLSHPEIHFMIKNAQKYKEKLVEAKDLGIRALDTDLLQIELEQPNPNFIRQLAQPFFFPIFGSVQEPKWFNGPYLVHEQDKDAILLMRNPYFWNTKNHYFDEIEIRWDSGIHNIYKLFRQGKVDWIGDPISNLPPDLIQDLQKDGELHQQEVDRRFLVHFNTLQPVLSSSFIRYALSIAIDRSLICENIYKSSKPFAPPKPCREEANAFFERGLKELGLTRETFPILTFTYSHQAKRKTLVETLKNGWHDILGIKIELEENDWNHFRNRLEKGLFEISVTIQESPEEHNPWHFEKFEGPSSWNFSDWNHPDFGRLIAKAKIETDEILRQELLSRANQILLKEAPFTPLFKYTHRFAHSPNLKGHLTDSEGCIDFSKAYY